jgi:DNA-binding NtrC family response regulator
MPGLDGVAALKEIRTIAAGVPVIMVTGNESTRVAGDVIGLGAFSYLPKPVRFQYLHHIVASILERGPRPGKPGAPLDQRTKTSAVRGTSASTRLP